MRRICHLVLAGLVVTTPLETFGATKKKHKAAASAAAEDEAREAEAAQSETTHRRRRHKRDGPAEVAPTAIDVSPATPAPTRAPAAAPTEDEDEGPNIVGELGEIDENPSRLGELFVKFVPPRRYPYVLGAAFAGLGLVWGYVARGQANVAQSPVSAHQAQVAIADAQSAAALANLMYGLAIASVVTAVLLEFLPEPVAEKASLTYHF